MKFPELKGLTLNVFLPTVLWALSVANAFMAVWIWSGPRFYLATAAIALAAVGFAAAMRVVAGLLREHAHASHRIALYLGLLIGLSAASWDLVPPMFEEKKVEVKPPSPPAPEPPTDGLQPFVPAGPERMAHVPANVMDLITQARRALGSMEIDASKCSGDGDGILACRGDYILAVTNAKGEVDYVTVYEKGEPSKPGYMVTLGGNGGRASGVNPDIAVSHPPGMTVLALKTAINWAGSGTWAVYVPYSPEINTPEVRAAGVAYLWSQVTKAREDLRKAKVRSQFFEKPGQESVPKKDREKALVADVIPADHAFTLVLTENVTHPEPFTAGGSNVRRLELLNEALAQLGANQAKAWDFRASRVGARGKGQFMPKTYKALCSAYGISCPAHEEGARDDSLTFRLMFLHADDEWRGIKNRDWLMGQPLLMRLYLAAGYNGFYGNAAKAIRSCGVSGWRQPAPACAKPLASETRPYLDKYEWIRGQHWEATLHDAVAAEVYPGATVETTPDAEKEETE